MTFVSLYKIITLHLMDEMNTPLSLVSNDAFREIFQGMSEGIVMVDDKGKIVVANKIAEQIFGYTENELTGTVMENLLPERYRRHHVNHRKGFNAHPEPRRMGFGRDLTALRKDGTEFPVEISLSYTQLKDQLLVMAFISDITLRKKAEEALKQSEEQLIVYAAELEKKVQSRTEALHITIQALEKEINERKRAEEEARKALDRERELNDLKTKFVSIASHEFRTPLSTVLSSASLINQYNEREEHDKEGKQVQRIKSSVNHLTSILNDFLSLGKLEEGVIDVNAEFLSVKDFMEEVEEEISPMLKNGQKLKLEYQTDEKILYTDPKILRNILFNLISNAIKYSEINKFIYVKCGFEDNQFVFTVSDEGIGIPNEDQKHMFERFFRASNAGNVQGTGLGLNIVRRYVELLSGSISFESKYGRGSDFKVMIPGGDN